MQVYLVFGDPRRADKRAVFTREGQPSNTEIYTNSARVVFDGDALEGGLLGAGVTEAGEDYLSILISEEPPSIATRRAMVNSGWGEATQCPYPEHLPFLVQTTLVLERSGEFEAWTKPMWFPHAFVPTQRTVLALGSEAEIPVKCLNMTLKRDGRHQALFSLALSESDGLSFLRFDNWIRIPSNDGEWSTMERAAECLEAEVAYVLGATVVSGVTIHEIDGLSDDKIWKALPSDVLDETVLALYELGREDLIRVEFRRE